MSVILHVQSVLFDPSVPEEQRKGWLQNNGYKAKFGNTKSEKKLDDLISYKQFNPTAGRQQFRVQLDDRVWGHCELASTKGKRKNPRKPKDPQSADDQEAGSNVAQVE